MIFLLTEYRLSIENVVERILHDLFCPLFSAFFSTKDLVVKSEMDLDSFLEEELFCLINLWYRWGIYFIITWYWINNNSENKHRNLKRIYVQLSIFLWKWQNILRPVELEFLLFLCIIYAFEYSINQFEQYLFEMIISYEKTCEYV